MERKQFIKQLVKEGCFLLRHGSGQDVYKNQANGKKQPVPRHTEIDDQLAKHIRKYLGLE